MFNNLPDGGKPEWLPMLSYVAQLHARSVHPPRAPFALPWEEIGPGYCYGLVFGHWDIIHQVLDTLPAASEHFAHQIRNLLGTQREDGFLPSLVNMRQDPGVPSMNVTHPPLWPMAVADYFGLTGDRDLLRLCQTALLRQIGWFERARRLPDGGFYYQDVVEKRWESGVDDGVRWDHRPAQPQACVDATCHLYALYSLAADWGETLGDAQPACRDEAGRLLAFIRDRFWDEETGFFHDAWSVGRPEIRSLAFEGVWPLVVGAATERQATRVIDESLLNPRRFFTPHPMATVSREDPRFELRCWRGPAWNSMTYWAARGCAHCGRPDAARRILEAALDSSAARFGETGTIWEFYDPDGGDPRRVARKPYTEFNSPCPEYLGHNPLLAMARLWGDL